MADADWREELDGWLEPFLAALGHGKRRRWAPVYLRGLLGPGDRKSLQPMAARLGLRGHDQLHHFVASTAWDDAPLRRLLVERADALVGGPGAVLVVDDTALPKQGRLSVGVARQYCGASGKRANCQVLVSLTLARGEVPVPVGLRLFLPEAWAADPDRCARAGVPDEHRRAEPKTDDRARRDRSRAGRRRPFRPRGRGRRLRDQRRLPPGPERARPGLGGRHPEGAERLLDRGRAALAQGGHGTAAQASRAERGAGPGRAGAGGRRVAPHLLAARHQGAARGRVRRPAGAPGRGRSSSGTAGTCPARRSGSSASAAPRASRSTTSRTCPPTRRWSELAALIKARWVCEQAHQQLKEELGLDHFEGRSWTGLHRHALMAMIALCFLQHLRLRERGEKRGRAAGTAAAADPARGPTPAARALQPRPGPLPMLRV